MTDSANGTSDLTYNYDFDGRLTDVNGTSAGSSYSASYTYDLNGSTLTQTINNVLTTDTWDLEGRLLSSVTTGGPSSSYTYDDSGNRVSQTAGGQTTTYLNDANQAYDQVLEEYGESGGNAVLAATYVRGLDLLFQDRTAFGGGTGLSYYAVDGLGSTRALTNSSGAATDTYTYDAFGSLIGSTGTTTNEFLFAGYQFDVATGDDYLRARYYNAAAGQFTSRDAYNGETNDPITENSYLYANADPVNVIDLSGHDGDLVSTLGASSIGSEIDAIEGEAAEHVLEAAEDVSEGVSIDQAILSRVVAKGNDFAMSVALGVGVSALLAAGKAVAGFAHINGKLVVPGTLLPRSREIPGILGKVTGEGDSQTLLRNLLKANGLKAQPARGYATHHLIPVVVAKRSPVIKKIGMNIDDATNGILLLRTGAGRVHSGSHDEYSDAVEAALNLIPESLSIEETMDRVYEIQARAAWAFADGMIVTRPRLDESQWLSILTGGGIP